MWWNGSFGVGVSLTEGSGKMSEKMPLVLENDDGIRPAGEPDECFYCHQKIGEPHLESCVCVTKRVIGIAAICVDVSVPYSWDKKDIEFHRNESSYCAGNLLSDIDTAHEALGEENCPCSSVYFEYLRDSDVTPRAFAKGEVPPPLVFADIRKEIKWEPDPNEGRHVKIETPFGALYFPEVKHFDECLIYNKDHFLEYLMEMDWQQVKSMARVR